MSMCRRFVLITVFLLTCIVIHSPQSVGATLLFSDNFESGMGNWSNDTVNDNKDWTRDSGGTPSSNTGPASGADGSPYYMYLETSSGSAYTAGDTAILLGPSIINSNIRFSFKYHMYGANIGTLSVDVLSGTVWINDVWSISGQQQSSTTDAYTQVDLDLDSYNVAQIRFRATAVGGYMGDMAIDSVQISTVPTGPVAPVFVSDPFSKTDAYQDSPYSDSIAADADDYNGDALTFSKISGPDWLSVAADGTLSGTPGSSDLGINSFEVEVSDGDLSDHAILEIYVSDEDPPVQVSYTDFELGMGDWRNVVTVDDYDWTRHSGATPSSGTGPSGGADGSTYYMYMETSSGYAYYAGDSAILLGPVIFHRNIHLFFQYHMYGAAIGTLSVDVLSGENWINDVWSVSGQQQSGNTDPYTAVEVDLSDYTISQIRLRATAAGDFTGDIAVDNLEIRGTPPAPAAPQFFTDPVVKADAFQGYAYSESLGADAMDINGDAIVFSKLSGPDWLTVAPDGTLSGTPGSSDAGTNSFTIQASDGELGSSATLTIFVSDSAPPVVLSYTDFETGFGDWTNVSADDDYDWLRDSAGTPSSNTGPSTGADGSTYYLYLETSSGSGAYNAGDTAILLGPAVDATNIQLIFQYHMYGATIGTLAVDVLSDGVWITDVWSVSGQQQISSSEVYATADVDLSGYNVSRIRLRATAAGNYMGDMAIDNLTIKGIDAIAVDADNDGVADAADLCPDTPAGETVDTDGCADSQKDTDGDGVNDDLDSCPSTQDGATVDANGCADSQKDSDNDGVTNDLDQCALTPAGATVDANGCSDSQKDSDGDGVTDDLDTCSGTPSGETVDTDGCADSQKDTDADGVMDNIDLCAFTPAGEPVDTNGCADSQKDSDIDGITDNVDLCPDTPLAEPADANGCSDSQKDTDGDGVTDNIDLCAFTPVGETVDASGCADSQKDSDIDGVTDDVDLCPDTPLAEPADANGCADSQKDTDGDGVNDALDICPTTPSGEIVDASGCSDSERDTDQDGVLDIYDDFPSDPTEWVDTDGDGVGDNADTDDDDDGLSDIDEWDFYGTDPHNPDMDSDGYLDGEEIYHGSDPFDSFSRPLDHFDVAFIPSPQFEGTPFDVVISAMDSGNATIQGYDGSVNIFVNGADGGSSEVTIGDGSMTWDFPLNTNFHDARTQTIYLADEIGGAKIIQGLALNVVSIPGQTMHNWTIRMRHTDLDDYSASQIWESDWAVVYQADTTITSTGWVVFTFQTPFAYNGADNLMVDFSFNNDTYTYSSEVVGSSYGTERTLHYFSDSYDGDPLNWSGTAPTPPYPIDIVPDIKLISFTSAEVVIGDGNSTSEYPLFTDYEDTRTQTIYLADEIGGTKTFQGLALDVETPPFETINNWTIRMRHTDLADYASWPAWESDWTVVYQGEADITATGWVTFIFQTSFEYNGVDNLMIDFSFNNDWPAPSGYCRYSTDGSLRSIYYYSNGLDGDPLNWSEISSPAPYVMEYVPNIKLVSTAPPPFTLESFGSWNYGEWFGTVTILQGSGQNIHLTVDDDAGHTAQSNLFEVVKVDSDGDGVSDALDLCPYTPAGEETDSNGCADSEKDTDGDGVTDDLDLCASTPAGQIVAPDGCTDAERDLDYDGVPDIVDTCLNTPAGEPVDADGCGDSQKDADNDGISDDLDACPATPVGEAVYGNGCADSQIDAYQPAIAAGRSHTVAISGDGRLFAWGSNRFNQLGDGTNIDKAVSTQIGTDTDWLMVAAGQNYTVAIKVDGTLWAWGSNDYGQLGDGTNTARAVPVQTGAANDWLSVSAGATHVLAVTRDGRLFAWGGNSSGQIGDGTLIDRTSPVQIGSDNDWLHVAAGNSFSAAIKMNGTLFTWGSDSYGQLGNGPSGSQSYPTRVGAETDWVMVGTGSNHAAAVKTDGTLYCWGSNSNGQLGDGTFDYSDVPIQTGSDDNWARVSAGFSHTLALREGGTLYAWGGNDYGQVGDGTTADKRAPVQTGLDPDWATIAAGDFHNIARKSDGTIYTWGRNTYGVLGIGAPADKHEPFPTDSGNDWVSVHANYHQTLATKADGNLYAWGHNGLGQLGDGTNVSRKEAVQIASGIYFSLISAGYYHTAGITTDGTLYAWGSNSYGQFGNGTTTASRVPVQIGSDSDWLIVDAGVTFTLGLKSDGTLYAWGINNDGQLGIGTRTNSYSPVQVDAEGVWVAIAAGDSQAYAIKSDGSLWAWGDNYYGQLGNGNTTDQLLPVQIGSEYDWATVKSHVDHVVAIKTDGALYAWGRNTSGQLGDGTRSNRTSPVQIGTEKQWMAIAAGRSHSLAITTDGALYAWGDNYYGQLGDGTTVDKTSPIQIGTDNDWQAVAAGNYHSFALKTENTLYGWGYNIFGQLGDETAWETSPVLISLEPQDSDADGIIDGLDACPNTPSGESVDPVGCADTQKDSDNDGVTNNLDLCAATPAGESVDADGCSDSQKDTDNDGITDDLDVCPNTPDGETTDVNGCSASQLDADNDTVSDDIDTCPDTAADETVDENGCSDSQKDTDNDGVTDNLDVCPDTLAGWPVNTSGCSACIIPISDFETDTGGWQNVSAEDSHDWIRNSGQTATSGTGPVGGAADSSFYMYFETSSGFADFDGDTAILQSPAITCTDVVFSFQYHMYGSDIGTLAVDVLENGQWLNNVWSISGQQQSSSYESYSEVDVDLTNYAVQLVRLRARAIGGTSGDIAVDNLEITGVETGAELPAKKVFVTSQGFTGNLGGLSGADAICQTEAVTAGLPGTFKAWLSDNNTAVADRLTHLPFPYQRVDGTIVAYNWDDLLDGYIENPINLDASGNTVSGFVWTGSDRDGTKATYYLGDYPDGYELDLTCDEWTMETASFHYLGHTGNINDVTAWGDWWQGDGSSCTSQLGLYCIEQ